MTQEYILLGTGLIALGVALVAGFHMVRGGALPPCRHGFEGYSGARWACTALGLVTYLAARPAELATHGGI